MLVKTHILSTGSKHPYFFFFYQQLLLKTHDWDGLSLAANKVTQTTVNLWSKQIHKTLFWVLNDQCYLKLLEYYNHSGSKMKCYVVSISIFEHCEISQLSDKQQLARQQSRGGMLWLAILAMPVHFKGTACSPPFKFNSFYSLK